MDITFNDVAQKIPSYALCNMIGNDSETVYILDLTTKEKFECAVNYLDQYCMYHNALDAKYMGCKIIIELDTTNKDWYCVYGTIDEYFEGARQTLEDYFNLCKCGQHSTRQKRQIMV